jgi:hypothetical protein
MAPSRAHERHIIDIHPREVHTEAAPALSEILRDDVFSKPLGLEAKIVCLLNADPKRWAEFASEERSLGQGDSHNGCICKSNSCSNTPKMSPSESAPPTDISEQKSFQDIAALAYRYWQARGCPDGSPEEDWFKAEQEPQGRG